MSPPRQRTFCSSGPPTLWPHDPDGATLDSALPFTLDRELKGKPGVGPCASAPRGTHLRNHPPVGCEGGSRSEGPEWPGPI